MSPLSATPVTTTRRTVTLMFVTGMLLISVAILWAVTSNRGAAASNCREVETIKAYIRETIRPERVGLPGTPGYAYYRLHPAELRVARRQALDAQRRFAPGPCPRDA